MFFERQTECGEKGVALLVGAGRCYESNLKTVDARILVDVDFREDDLLLETESVVSSSVHILGDTVEVTDTRESNPDELLEELVHLHVAEGNFGADRHTLTELEVGHVLLGSGDDSFLTGDDGKLCSCLLNDLLVLGCVADTLVDGDLHEARNLHHGSIGELLCKLLHDFLFVDLLKGRNISCRHNLSLYWCVFLCHNYLISSPDFLA